MKLMLMTDTGNIFLRMSHMTTWGPLSLVMWRSVLCALKNTTQSFNCLVFQVSGPLLSQIPAVVWIHLERWFSEILSCVRKRGLLVSGLIPCWNWESKHSSPHPSKAEFANCGPTVTPRRDYIGCSGGWGVFYIWINCQCLKIIRFHCFSQKIWQCDPRPHMATIC